MIRLVTIGWCVCVALATVLPEVAGGPAQAIKKRAETIELDAGEIGDSEAPAPPPAAEPREAPGEGARPGEGGDFSERSHEFEFRRREFGGSETEALRESQRAEALRKLMERRAREQEAPRLVQPRQAEEVRLPGTREERLARVIESYDRDGDGALASEAEKAAVRAAVRERFADPGQ